MKWGDFNKPSLGRAVLHGGVVRGQVQRDLGRLGD
jgi:hypothetical protein